MISIRSFLSICALQEPLVRKNATGCFQGLQIPEDEFVKRRAFIVIAFIMPNSSEVETIYIYIYIYIVYVHNLEGM